jgi:hypothetical protein
MLIRINSRKLEYCASINIGNVHDVYPFALLITSVFHSRHNQFPPNSKADIENSSCSKMMFFSISETTTEADAWNDSTESRTNPFAVGHWTDTNVF